VKKSSSILSAAAQETGSTLHSTALGERAPLIPGWLIWSLLAVLCWGLWAIIFKVIGNALTAGQSQALSTIGLLPILLALGARKKSTAAGSRTRGALFAFGAGILACAGNVTYYYALSLGGKASTVVALTALYPLVTIILAVIVLRERLNSIQLFGIVLSLTAIWLFNVTGIEGMATGSLAYAFLPILFWGLAGLLQKISTNHIPGELSTLWFLLAFVPVGLGLLAMQPLPHSLHLGVWLLASALGLMFGLGNFALLMAFAGNGKASVITPLTGLYPIVSVPAAIIFFSERIGAREWLGIVVALVSVIGLSWETRRPKPAEVVRPNS